VVWEAGAEEEAKMAILLLNLADKQLFSIYLASLILCKGKYVVE
jgi:hypothetical protein